MPMKTQTFFLEEWLRSNITTTTTNKPSPSSSARAIIQAWAELRDSLQNQSFQPHHFQSLQTLLNSQTSLHVADPQAKLLLSILSSPNFITPIQSHHLFLKLLYIWLRKSSKPFVSLVELTVSVVSGILSSQFDVENGYLVLSYGVLLLGGISSIPNLSESFKRICLELLCKLMEQQKQLISSSEELIPEVLAGIGYALSSSDVVYFRRILCSLFEIWSKGSGLSGRLVHGLMILHLFEWVLSGFVGSRSVEKIESVCQEILGIYRLNNIPFAVVMAAAGVLRALNKIGLNSSRVGISAQVKISLEECIESVARDLISTTQHFSNFSEDRKDRVVLQCISMGVTRSGLTSYRGPLFLCFACALLVEIFPLRSFYTRIVEYPHGNFTSLGHEVKEHTDSILFKEAGAVTRMLCNLYISADEENKTVVENLIWGYCQDLYCGHQQVAMVLQGGRKVVLDELEKIAEACFLMIVIFASVVTKHRLNSEISSEIKLEISVRILISFSCVEYFRRVRLPEYTDTIRGVVVSVQENESSCVSFIKSLPSYSDLTKNPEPLSYGKPEYIWSKNDVQTARVLFYLRVIPTCIERVSSSIYRELVAPTMFLYPHND
ncbi:hypothetical protein AQUCO_01300523v1 [Aquilegia coerulea]|uniref:Uncharacterized protein n=1 Tax=Aquilegia coerulea TaxID=218851 RepID=A0A2G5E265_AQUCA|nr:hypothetical protein AQUCO_01300523v1 [Aquilegia coerulea]